MKILFISDIHGSCKKLEQVMVNIKNESPDSIVLLGDLLYHGPRNALPSDYDSAVTAELLNSMKDKIVAVRGNCDSEVDQMVLDFPIMSDYLIISVDNIQMFLTHGHLYSPTTGLPKLKTNSIFISGHTHIPEIEFKDNLYIYNPGSLGIPKGGSTNTYGIYEKGYLKNLDLEGNIIKQLEVKISSPS